MLGFNEKKNSLLITKYRTNPEGRISSYAHAMRTNQH